MELQHLALAISIANFVLTWGVALYMYLANKNKVTNERINKLQDDIDEWKDDHQERIAVLETATKGVPTHGDRIARLETGAENVPTHDDLGSIHERITALDSKVSAQGGKLDGIDATLRQLLSRVMERGMP